jgi:hypothetical protein
MQIEAGKSIRNSKAHALILFLWMGDPWGRLFKAIKDTRPNETFVIIESRDAKWKEFQEEGMRKLKKRLGEPYADSIHEIKFDQDVEEKEFLGGVIAKLCEIVRKIKDSYERTEILWDVTGAPVNVMLMVPLVASFLSSENCDVAAQYVSGKETNDPILHAPKSSEYAKKHAMDLNGISQKPLIDYNERRAEDPGESIHVINFPSFRFDLFGESLESLAQQILFLKLPDNKSQMLKTDTIRNTFTLEENQVLAKAAKIRQEKAKKTNMDIDHSIGIWVSTTIQKFGETKLVEHERVSIYIRARRSYCGDFFVPAVKDLLNYLMSKYHIVKS